MSSLTTDERVEELREQVDRVLAAYKKNDTVVRKTVYAVVAVIFMVFLALVPVLAIQGNVGGSIILGVLFLAWLFLQIASKTIMIGYVAYLDAETERITHKTHNTPQRLGLIKK